jgi:rhodanese-related sulfurtransferase
MSIPPATFSSKVTRPGKPPTGAFDRKLDEIKERMQRGEVFTFIDTRNPQAWGDADTKLPGAIRVPAEEVEQLADQIPRDRTVITYCT